MAQRCDPGTLKAHEIPNYEEEQDAPEHHGDHALRVAIRRLRSTLTPAPRHRSVDEQGGTPYQAQPVIDIEAAHSGARGAGTTSASPHAMSVRVLAYAPVM